MKTKNIGFIGGGRITKIFLQACTNKQVDFQSILVYDINTEILSGLKRQFPKINLSDTISKVAKQDIVFIALHPPAIMEALENIRDHISKDTLIISLAPKITIDKIAAKCGSGNIVRLIPNATSFISEGYNPYCFSNNYSGEKDLIPDLLRPLGNNFEVPERKLEAYAIVSAMLPTYFWFQWKYLEELGISMGLEEEEAAKAIYETMAASLNLMYRSGLKPDQVTDLIPVKPIGEHESEIVDIYKRKLTGLYEKIRP